MLDGKVVLPDPMLQTLPGIPSRAKFDKQLKGCLCWIDFYGVPQVSTSANSASHNTTKEPNANESSSSSSDSKKAHDKMMRAISSLPAYVARSSMFFVLVPVVPHNELENHDCEYTTWQRRGWCRYGFFSFDHVTTHDKFHKFSQDTNYKSCSCSLYNRVEGVVRALESKQQFFVTIFGPKRIVLMPSEAMLHFYSTGCGDFACCTLNHTIDVAGVPTTIPCDRAKVSPLMHAFFKHSIMKLIREANESKAKDFSWYRLLLAHEHVILRNLPCIESRPKLDSWQTFAKAFRLHIDQPLKKSDGVLNLSPLVWAVLANNHVVVKYLLECNANITERAVVRKKVFFFYNRSSLLHLIMHVGHGESGKAIFDALLAAGCDPYQCRETTFSRPWGDPTIAAFYSQNVEMIRHYMSKVKPKFCSYSHWIGGCNGMYAMSFGNYEIIREFDRLGAKFERRTMFGHDSIGAFVGIEKEKQPVADVRYIYLKHSFHVRR